MGPDSNYTFDVINHLMGSIANWIPVWNILSILFQNIMITKLIQWIKNKEFESLSSHSVREAIT